MLRFCVICLVITAMASSAFATSPCVQLQEADFLSRVLKPADLILSATVEDFSSADHDARQQWTKITPMHVYKGKAPDTITINGWQAYLEPLYAYQKGDRLLLFLKNTGEGYALTNDRWKECVPSVTQIQEDGTVYPLFEAHMPEPPQKRIAVDALMTYFLSK